MLIPPFYTDFGKFSTGLWHAVFIIQALASSDISTGLPERFSLNKAASKPPALYLLMHKRTVFLLTSSFSEKVGYYHGNSDTIRQNSILSGKIPYYHVKVYTRRQTPYINTETACMIRETCSMALFCLPFPKNSRFVLSGEKRVISMV